MCYAKFHRCKFCGSEYICVQRSDVCPTVNNDRDTNMCPSCLTKLERLIEQHEIDVAQLALEEIMELPLNDD